MAFDPGDQQLRDRLADMTAAQMTDADRRDAARIAHYDTVRSLVDLEGLSEWSALSAGLDSDEVAELGERAREDALADEFDDGDEARIEPAG